MICNKCNHKLPDDSEFCQYCGNKLENVSVAPAPAAEEPKKDETSGALVVDIEPGVGDKLPEEALRAIIEMQAQNVVEAMEANDKSQPDNEGDADFGLVPEKPIYTLALQSVDGEREYLNKLFTVHGQKIKYTRRGSTSVEGINGMIDIYDTFLPNGQPYKTIYINMYGAKKSTRAPRGFVLNNASMQTNSAPQKEGTARTRYCSQCGSAINNKNNVCTGCGKKYSKGANFDKFSIIASLVSCAATFLLFLDSLIWEELEGGLSWLLIFFFYCIPAVFFLINRKKRNPIISTLCFCGLTFLFILMCAVAINEYIYSFSGEAMFFFYALMLSTITSLILSVIALFKTKWNLDFYYESIRYREKCYKRVERMKGYLDNGIITQEEFEKNKAEILKRIR